MAKTANPYDRREIEKRRGEVAGYMDVGLVPDILDDGRRAYPGFGLERLEMLLRDEFARGFNSGEGTMERRVEEEILPRVKRQVWDQGHAAGYSDGEYALARRIAEQFEDVVHGALADAGAVLADEKAPPEALRAMLSLTVRVMEALRRAHHEGFPEPVPC